jgi:hypothetical protein
MHLNIQFTFRNKGHSCNIYIDSTAHPCYIFVILTGKELIKEFGDEITIKTDCEKRLPKKDDYDELVELRESIFSVVKTMPEFMTVKKRMILLRQTQNSPLGQLSYN